MSEQLPVGPYKMLPLGDGDSIPWYMIPSDKHGRCTSPLTRADLIDQVHTGGFTDIFVFCHGWNNDWLQATSRYEAFFDAYRELREKHALADPQRGAGRKYRPLLVGLSWPSAILVLPDEKSPTIAAFDGAADAFDQVVALERDEVNIIAEELDSANVERFYELAQKADSASDADVRELAELLAPLIASADDGEEVGVPPDAADLAARARESGGIGNYNAGGEFSTLGGGAAGAIAAAGFWSKARDLVRATTVWMMKDRAGRVGARAGGPLLRDLLGASGDARVHLIGHSYGCKALLSAVCIDELPRPVDSVLLLQAAVSAECFAPDIGGGRPGGYRAALDRVKQPILATHTVHDVALHDVFHLVMRRHDDEGEIAIAAGDGAPPARAALGGWGPVGIDSQRLRFTMAAPVSPYDFGDDHARVVALLSDDFIKNHGDVVNEGTAWALYSQVVVP